MGNANQKKQHIERAEKTGILQLRNFNIKEIPADTLRLRGKLRNLDLSNNKIEQIPSFIGEFVALKNLCFDVNRLTFLPEEIGNLTKLESLSLAGNHLSELPDSFANLSTLKTLNLSGNRFTSFPAVVCRLKRLDVLDLSANKISSVPADVAELQATELILNQNRLNSVSPAIADCRKLKILRVQENCLQAGVFTEKILSDSQLNLIVFDGNLFDEKAFQQLNGYEKYIERYTATKKKMF